ncbi:tpr repeat-containing protein [Leptolyngbya sp. Heron Island J]|uniref:orc1/cdc6 family replication initiation protein n=1 Tax=Leptolyngbya sp. Heron Island J TaxID=1385935 RepID=UPI0003B979A4|nr:orc1/cdc6 family replication initiation protein [Leptolyngbya sp. Heron Island J]ESA35335.1 tpr repeat-containing protein [Leptolyngbya sp. Heron Island J]
MPPAEPFISRPEAEDFVQDFAIALEKPSESPIVFHPWGAGGVGKSHLTRQLLELAREKARTAIVYYGQTEGISEPIKLMAKLYSQIAEVDTWGGDPFWDRYNQYFDTLNQLETQSERRLGAVTDDQLKRVKNLVKLSTDVLGTLLNLSESNKKLVDVVGERGTDAAMLRNKDLITSNFICVVVERHNSIEVNGHQSEGACEP